MTVYSSRNSSVWHISPLCRCLGSDWYTIDLGFAWDNGLRCCGICARLAYDGYLFQPSNAIRDKTFGVAGVNSPNKVKI